ncbi:Uncharacterised protein [Enterobacter cloacae]|nr:Uncharacterised protein [Enterobacter cloacae]
MPTTSLPVIAAGSSVRRLFIFMPMMSWSGGVFAYAAPLPIISESASKHAPAKGDRFMYISPVGYVFICQSWLTVLASIYAKLMSSPSPGRVGRLTMPFSSIGSTRLLRYAAGWS